MGTSRSGGTLGVTGFADDRNAMTTTQARPDRFRDGLIQPFLVVAAVAGTAVQWPYRDILFRSVALPLFVLVSIAAVSWLRVTPRWTASQPRNTPRFTTLSRDNAPATLSRTKESRLTGMTGPRRSVGRLGRGKPGDRVVRLRALAAQVGGERA